MTSWWQIKPFNQGVKLIGPLDHIYVSWCHSSLEKWSPGCHQNNHPPPVGSVKLLLSVTFSGRWVMSSSNETLLLVFHLFFTLQPFEISCIVWWETVWEPFTLFRLMSHMWHLCPIPRSRMIRLISHKIKKESCLLKNTRSALSCFLSVHPKKTLG